MSAKPPAFDLKILNRVASALAETKDLREVKTLRDKANAACHFAKGAALGQYLQNYCAELKLRAERRAGEILPDLFTHGGDRRSSSATRSLKLAELGISHNQSALWRREAAVPEPVFEQYLAMANRAGQDITASGLVRFAHATKRERRRPSVSDPRHNNSVPWNGHVYEFDDSPHACRNGENHRAEVCNQETRDEPVRGLLVELANHRNLLAGVLSPICDGLCDLTLPLAQRRVIARILQEFADLISRLEQLLFEDSSD
jgi:hypothetical protein